MDQPLALQINDHFRQRGSNVNEKENDVCHSDWRNENGGLKKHHVSLRISWGCSLNFFRKLGVYEKAKSMDFLRTYHPMCKLELCQ
jgi:hypothetical protein